MPEEDGVKQNRSSPCNKELVLGKAGLKIETLKQMNWCRQNQRDESLLAVLYRLSAPNTCLHKVPPKTYVV